MPTLNVSPNPADTGSTITINGTGFANLKTRLLLDGAGSTTNIFRPAPDGTFKVGINVSTSAKTQVLVAQQQSGSTWVPQDSVSIVVRNPVPPDTTAPVATNIGVTGITQTNATVAWATSEVSTGAVEYGINTGYGSNTTVIPAANIFTLGLAGLTPDTTYHFRTINVDAAGNVGKSADNSFKTLAVVVPPTPTAPKTITEAQALLNAGGTYDWTGMTPLVGSLVLNKSGTSVTGVNLQGPQFGKIVKYVGGQNGITVKASGCSIINGQIRGYGDTGIWAETTGTTITGCVIEDVEYSGIMYISDNAGKITGNTIRRVGNNGGTPNDHNAYGIALSRFSGPVCKGTLVSGNVVEDVPYWHGLDAHSGDDITFENNIVKRCARGLFITTGGTPTEPNSNRILSMNNRYELKGWTSKVPQGGTNAVAETWYLANNGKSINAKISTLYPAGVYNLSNSSTLTITGTTTFVE